MLARQDELNAAMMALDDLDTFVSSPAAREMSKRMAAMTAAERKAGEDEIGHWNSYAHGTSVADAVLVDHGQAELVIARMEWWHGDPPVPCWTRALAVVREAPRGSAGLMTHLPRSGMDRGRLGHLGRGAPSVSSRWPNEAGDGCRLSRRNRVLQADGR